MHILRRLLLVWLMMISIAGFLQRKLMYPAERAESLPVAAFPELQRSFSVSRDVSLTTADGVTIRGWHLQCHETPSHGVILLFHGNGGHRAHRGNWYTIARSLNCDVLAIDYHGYGDSGGSPSEESLRLDAAAAWRWSVEQQKYDPGNVVIVGESLGGAVAVRLASELCSSGTCPAGLVLVSTFDSMVNAAAWHFPWLPVRWLLIDRYESDARIAKITCPLIQFHGSADGIVPVSFGENLFRQAPDVANDGRRKEFHVLPAADHNNVLPLFGRFVRDQVAKLLNK